MSFSQAEKMEIIRVVEGSALAVKHTLGELDVLRSLFHRWYSKCRQAAQRETILEQDSRE